MPASESSGQSSAEPTDASATLENIDLELLTDLVEELLMQELRVDVERRGASNAQRHSIRNDL